MNTYFENLRTRQNLTSGEIKAYQVYRFSPEEFILNEHLCDNEVFDFVNTLREAGVKSFVYTNTSTKVMDNFHDFIKYGCKFVEACNVEFFIFEESKKGLRFEV